MAVNTEITRTGAESSLSVIRKFSRRMQGTGIVKGIRARRYFSRALSETTKKKKALKRLARGVEIKKLIKEGKLTPKDTNARTQRHSAPHQTAPKTTAAAPAPTPAPTQE